MEGNIPASRRFARHFGCERPDLAPQDDLAYETLVEEYGSVVRFPLQHVRAVAELAGDDLRDALFDRVDASSALACLGVLDGVIFFLDNGRLRASLRTLQMLRASFVAAGRDPDIVPLVCLLEKAPTGECVTSELDRARQLLELPAERFFEVDSRTGEGAADALAFLVRLIRHSESETPRTADGAALAGELPVWVRKQIVSQSVFFEWPAVGMAGAGLLQAWRQCRSPELADLLDGELYTARNLRPAEFDHASWIARCRRRDPRDLPILLDTLFHYDCEAGGAAESSRWYPTMPLGEHTKQVIERVDGLCWWEDDPRITKRIASSLNDVTRYRRSAVWEALFRLLGRHSDPSVFAVAARLAASLLSIRRPNCFRDPAVAMGTTQLWDLLGRRFQEPIPGGGVTDCLHQDAWNALVERIRRPLPRVEDMEAVAADPKNDDVRRQVAERMRERGDPRGEFILLQLRKATGSLSPEEHEREQALKRTYAWDWLGPLADVVDVENSVFEKGYPVKLTVWTPNTRALQDVIGKPEWATVRELRWGGDPCWEEEAPDAPLVEHPIMKSLERVTTKMPEDPADLEALRRVAWAR